MKTVLAAKIDQESAFGVVLEHASDLTTDRIDAAIRTMWHNSTGLPLTSLSILLRVPYRESDALLIVDDNGVDVAKIIDAAVMFHEGSLYGDDDIVEICRVMDLMTISVD